MTNAAVIEAMLLRWGDTHSSGRTVTFQLPDDGGEHPFKGLKCGPANGQRLALSVALINDDESQSGAEPVNEPASAETSAGQSREAHTKGTNDPHLIHAGAAPDDKDKPSGAEPRKWTATQDAGLHCTMKSFQRFMFEKGYTTTEDGQEAIEAVRAHCGIASRRELDTDPEALDKWRSLTADYELWLKGF